MQDFVTLALGSNISGDFGAPVSAMRQVVTHFCNTGMLLVRASSLYETAPVGGGRQPRYLNAVVILKNTSTPSQLLREVKRIENLAGRRRRAVNTARPLDIDLISFRGHRIGWPNRRLDRATTENRTTLSSRHVPRRGAPKRGWLMLPHPEVHRRRFVLVPLLEVSPHWFHPVFRVSGRRLLARLPDPPGQIIRVLDSSWISCNIDTLEM